MSVAGCERSTAIQALDQGRRLEAPYDLDELEVIRTSYGNDRSTRLFCCSCHFNLPRGLPDSRGSSLLELLFVSAVRLQDEIP